MLLNYVQPHVLHAPNPGLIWRRPSLVWSLLDGTGSNPQIAIRGTPDGSLPLRIWYIAEAWVSSINTDTMLMSPRWQMLVALHAAKLLMAAEEEWSPNLAELYEDHRRQFMAFGRPAAGPFTLPDTV